MAERKKISELTELSVFTGTELLPLVSQGTNYSATMDSMKEYFKDSTLVLFDEFDDSSEIMTIGSTPQDEQDVLLSIVFMTKHGKFTQRRRKEGANDTYFTDFPRRNDYMTPMSPLLSTPRTDKVFFCLADRSQYTWDGSNMFDPYTPIVLTQEEFDALATKDENRTYYIYEEE